MQRVSPNIFSSDEEDMDETSDLRKEASIHHSTESTPEQDLLKELSSMLSGIPPPPSLATCKMSCAQMLENFQLHQDLWILPTCPCPIPEVNPKVFYFNSGKVSEEIAELTAKLQARFVQSETMSSYNTWAEDHRHLNNSGRKKKQWNGISPGRRLSHLARRRQMFSKANLQQMSQNEPKTNRLAIKTIIPSQRNLAKEYLEYKAVSAKEGLPKRALFQSPEEDSDRPGFRTVARHMPRRRLFENNSNNKSSQETLPPGGGSYDVSSWLATQPFQGGRKRGREESRDSDRKRRCPRRSLDFSDGSPSRSSDLSNLSSNLSAVVAAPVLTLTHLNKQKLLWAVAMALKEKKITHKDAHFKECASTLFNICKKNLVAIQALQVAGGTSERMLTYTKIHVADVVAKFHERIGHVQNVSENNQSSGILLDVSDSLLNQPSAKRHEQVLEGKENVDRTPRRKLQNRIWRSCLKSVKKSKLRLCRSQSFDDLRENIELHENCDIVGCYKARVNNRNNHDKELLVDVDEADHPDGKGKRQPDLSFEPDHIHGNKKSSEILEPKNYHSRLNNSFGEQIIVQGDVIEETPEKVLGEHCFSDIKGTPERYPVGSDLVPGSQEETLTRCAFPALLKKSFTFDEPYCPALSPNLFAVNSPTSVNESPNVSRQEILLVPSERLTVEQSVIVRDESFEFVPQFECFSHSDPLMGVVSAENELLVDFKKNRVVRDAEDPLKDSSELLASVDDQVHLDYTGKCDTSNDISTDFDTILPEDSCPITRVKEIEMANEVLESVMSVEELEAVQQQVKVSCDATAITSDESGEISENDEYAKINSSDKRNFMANQYRRVPPKNTCFIPDVDQTEEVDVANGPFFSSMSKTELQELKDEVEVSPSLTSEGIEDFPENDVCQNFNPSEKGEMCTSTPLLSFPEKLVMTSRPIWKAEAGPGLKVRVRLSKEWDILGRELSDSINESDQSSKAKSAASITSGINSELSKSSLDKDNSSIDLKQRVETQARHLKSLSSVELSGTPIESDGDNSSNLESNASIGSGTGSEQSRWGLDEEKSSIDLKVETQARHLKRFSSAESSGTSMDSYTLMEMRDRIAIEKTLEADDTELSFISSDSSSMTSRATSEKLTQPIRVKSIVDSTNRSINATDIYKRCEVKTVVEFSPEVAIKCYKKVPEKLVKAENETESEEEGIDDLAKSPDDDDDEMPLSVLFSESSRTRLKKNLLLSKGIDSSNEENLPLSQLIKNGSSSNLLFTNEYNEETDEDDLPLSQLVSENKNLESAKHDNYCERKVEGRNSLIVENAPDDGESSHPLSLENNEERNEVYSRHKRKEVFDKEELPLSQIFKSMGAHGQPTEIKKENPFALVYNQDVASPEEVQQEFDVKVEARYFEERSQAMNPSSDGIDSIFSDMKENMGKSELFQSESSSEANCVTSLTARFDALLAESSSETPKRLESTRVRNTPEGSMSDSSTEKSNKKLTLESYRARKKFNLGQEETQQQREIEPQQKEDKADLKKIYNIRIKQKTKKQSSKHKRSDRHRQSVESDCYSSSSTSTEMVREQAKAFVNAFSVISCMVEQEIHLTEVAISDHEVRMRKLRKLNRVHSESKKILQTFFDSAPEVRDMLS